MGRAWRIEYEGALYYVLSRGNERREILWQTRTSPQDLIWSTSCYPYRRQGRSRSV